MRSKIRWMVAVSIVILSVRSALAGGYTLTASPARIAPGGLVQVSWTAPVGGTTGGDWIALYEVGTNNNQYMTFQYTGGATSGSLNFAAPTDLGLFEFRYLLNYGFTHAAVTNAIEVACTSGTVVTGPEVLLLSGGDFGSDCANQAALEARGFQVTVGPAIPDWDGTQFDLSDFAAVLLPHNINWPIGLSPAGIEALSDYVIGGGGLVTGEWALWGAFSRGQTSFLELAPVESYCGFNYAPATTYTQARFDPLIHDGLPASFDLALRSVAGTESCFGARSAATVFFTSSNGGGTAGADGLVGWNYGLGRVASFSTLLTSYELSNPDYARLLGNTVAWVKQGACSADAATPATVGALADCLLGPDEVLEVGCEGQDLDCNGRVDLRDAAFFQRTYDVP